MVPLEPYSEYYYEWIHILNYTSITTPHTREATVTYISTKKNKMVSKCKWWTHQRQFYKNIRKGSLRNKKLSASNYLNGIEVYPTLLSSISSLAPEQSQAT